MAESISQRRTGIALVVAAAVAWSTAPFFTRLLALDSWTILFWRGLFAGGLIGTVMVLTQGRAGLRDLFTMGSSGWLVNLEIGRLTMGSWSHDSWSWIYSAHTELDSHGQH